MLEPLVVGCLAGIAEKLESEFASVDDFAEKLSLIEFDENFELSFGSAEIALNLGFVLEFAFGFVECSVVDFDFADLGFALLANFEFSVDLD